MLIFTNIYFYYNFMELKVITKNEFLKSYSFHKNHYWDRKLNENFNLELLFGEKNIKKAIKIFKDNVDVINLETSSYCNRECGYCPVSLYGRNFNINIDQKLFDNVTSALERINYDKSFCLNLYNEPLADKKFINHVSKIRKKLPKCIIQTNSNGDYIKNINDLINLEIAGLNKIKITLHTPKKRDFSKDYMKLSLNKFAKKLNLKLNKNHISQLNFNFKIGKLYVDVQCPNWFLDGNYRGETLKNIKKIKKRNNPCVKPFREFTIYYNGNITPCCDIYNSKNYNKNNIGKINLKNKNSKFQIYCQKKLSDWRRDLFGWNTKKGVCANCSSQDLAAKKDSIKREKILSNY